jgi:GT2 family glycosyltransferase
MKSPKVVVTILNWNGLADTIECLESLKCVTYPNFVVVVVDNGSKGADADILEHKYGDYIHLVRNVSNYGFAKGNNIAIEWSLERLDPQYFLLLNNDTVVDPEFLTGLVALSESDDTIGIVGPKIYYHDRPDTIQSFGAKISFRSGATKDRGWKQRDTGQFEREAAVDYVNGCALLVKRKVVEAIGLLDPVYFCYYEETDFCTRARIAGFRIVVTPKSRIWHKKKLGEKWLGLGLEEKGSASSFFYMGRNVFIFMKKHGATGSYRRFVFSYFLFKAWFTSAVCILYHSDIKQLIAYWRGIKAGLTWGKGHVSAT